MSGEWTLTTTCDAPDRGFDDEGEAREQRDSHIALCEDCSEGDVEVISPEGKDSPDPTTGASEAETSADGGNPEPPTREEPDAADIQSQEEFVTEIAGVPDAFVVDMGRGKDSKPYVTKEGLAHIARKLNLQVRAEPIIPSWEADGKVAYRGIVEDDEGRTWTDVGTADVGQETIGDENLDELASTRATNRALRLATGAGMTSLEEMENGAPNAVSDGPEPEVIDAEVDE